MAIGRPDGRENPCHPPAHPMPPNVFGPRPRGQSGPAAIAPQQQAGHMSASAPPPKNCKRALASKGPSTHGWPGQARPRGWQIDFTQTNFALADWVLTLVKQRPDLTLLSY